MLRDAVARHVDYAVLEEANGRRPLDAVLGDFAPRRRQLRRAAGRGRFAVTSPKEKSAWRQPAACYWPPRAGRCTATCRACARSTSP